MLVGSDFQALQGCFRFCIKCLCLGQVQVSLMESVMPPSPENCPPCSCTMGFWVGPGPICIDKHVQGILCVDPARQGCLGLWMRGPWLPARDEGWEMLCPAPGWSGDGFYVLCLQGCAEQACMEGVLVGPGGPAVQGVPGV